MPKKKKNNKLPPDVVDHWPDVFDEIEIKAVPIEYIQEVMIHFHTGKVWEINIDQSKVTDQGSDALEPHPEFEEARSLLYPIFSADKITEDEFTGILDALDILSDDPVGDMIGALMAHLLEKGKDEAEIATLMGEHGLLG